MAALHMYIASLHVGEKVGMQNRNTHKLNNIVVIALNYQA